MSLKIPGQDKIEAVIGRTGYTAFSKVSALTFWEDSELAEPGYSVTLALESDRPGENYRIRMRFSGVKDLTLKDFGGWPTQITGFDIIDISERQLEGIWFKVTDYENGVIRFFCGAAEVEQVERIG